MAEFWNSEVLVEAEPEAEVAGEPEKESVLREEKSAPAEMPAPAALTVSIDDFTALEERVLRAVALVKQERQARLAADERAARIEAQMREQAPQMECLEAELAALKAERDQVRQRVDRLLQQLDALEL